MGLDTFTIFINLVKGYDSVKHDIISTQKDGSSEKYIQWIEKLYSDFNIVLKIRKKEVRIRHGYGVQKKDNLAPVLFITVIQLIVEDIIIYIKKANVDTPEIKCTSNGSRVTNALEDNVVKGKYNIILKQYSIENLEEIYDKEESFHSQSCSYVLDYISIS